MEVDHDVITIDIKRHDGELELLRNLMRSLGFNGEVKNAPSKERGNTIGDPTRVVARFVRNGSANGK
ncbi:MAG: hypothetical protein KGH94_03450 [Candidatus Micrarchaeota archaeon]|nr:hypothetical protein [Candidatus Micrarchaeota archaeon]